MGFFKIYAISGARDILSVKLIYDSLRGKLLGR